MIMMNQLMKLKGVLQKINTKAISLMMERKNLMARNIKKEREWQNYIHLKKNIFQNLNILLNQKMNALKT